MLTFSKNTHLCLVLLFSDEYLYVCTHIRIYEHIYLLYNILCMCFYICFACMCNGGFGMISINGNYLLML